MRFQKNGGAGGQHGVESIIEGCGGVRHFDRLKIGVGPDPGGSERADYVLSPVLPAERELFERCLCLAAEAVEFWCRRGIAEAMNKYNGIDLRQPPAPSQTSEALRESSE
jgi:peptidyl-tRNA hydrolase